MNKTIILEILKYLILSIVIFTVLKYLPNQNMSNCDIALTSVILLLIYLLLESLVGVLNTKKQETFNNNTQDKINFCSSVCNNSNNNIEGMASVPSKKKHKKHHKKKQLKDLNTEESESESMSEDTKSKLSDSSKETEQDDTKEKSVDAKKYNRYIKDVEKIGTRYIEGVIEKEDEYSDYNHVPLGDRYDEDSFEYGYSFLPPEKWYPQPPNPPMCVTDKRCPVIPTYTQGTPLDAKEWNESRRITQPDNIKVKYVKEKLNSGR